jgi:hypothetical protein
VQGHRHSQQQRMQKQRHDAAVTSRAAEDASYESVHVQQDGRLLVEAQVLQLLLDKVGESLFSIASRACQSMVCCETCACMRCGAFT